MTLEAIKRHLVSLVVTFVATFLLVISFEISNPDFNFSLDALRVLAVSGIVAGARSVAKIVYEVVYDLLKK